MSRLPCPSVWTFAVESVIRSTSPVPNVPWPVSYFQFAVLTPCPAGPLNVSFHTCVHSVPMIMAVVGDGLGVGRALAAGSAAALRCGLTAAG